jgi:sterol desaturase/sphingolipid hydroxylase (fatty acid hydroxylase superfamily)
VNDVVFFSPLIPLIAFVALLLIQSVLPRRPIMQSGVGRMMHNYLLFVVNVVLMRFVVPWTLLGVAAWANGSNFGLFNHLSVPPWMAVLLSVVILDFAIYWQHVATHKFPLLWRMHKVHHADFNMDVSTAIRFHPLELLLSLGFKAVCVVALGAPLLAVAIFELLLFIGPAFNHSNTRLPETLDRVLRWFIATPDTHRAHHSTVVAEQNTNYGFFIIWWDRLFGTYTQVPQGGHEGMSIGLNEGEQCERVDQMLLAPFK